MSIDPRAKRRTKVVTVSIPFAVRKHGGRKLIVQADLPANRHPLRTGPDATLLKALGRAFRWRKLLENGAYATSREIARAERINPSYVARVLRLTLLSPEIVEAIIDGRRRHPSMAALPRPFPIEWDSQKRHFYVSDAARAAPILAPQEGLTPILDLRYFKNA